MATELSAATRTVRTSAAVNNRPAGTDLAKARTSCLAPADSAADVATAAPTAISATPATQTAGRRRRPVLSRDGRTAPGLIPFDEGLSDRLNVAVGILGSPGYSFTACNSSTRTGVAAATVSAGNTPPVPPDPAHVAVHVTLAVNTKTPLGADPDDRKYRCTQSDTASGSTGSYARPPPAQTTAGDPSPGSNDTTDGRAVTVARFGPAAAVTDFAVNDWPSNHSHVAKPTTVPSGDPAR